MNKSTLECPITVAATNRDVLERELDRAVRTTQKRP